MVKGIILYPGGNSTAIVETPVLRKEQKDVSLLILNKYKDVEQVAFVENDGNYLQMAGGEFCCNAARAFGFLKLKGSDGNTTFNMSGTNYPIFVTVKSLVSEVSIPVQTTFDKILKSSSDGFIVSLSGITHFVVTESSSLFKKNAGKEYANDILEKFNLKNELASAVSFLSNSYELEPYVFVKEINTLYAETACGSGSIAVAIVHSWLNKKVSVQNLKILQPSGTTLNVSLSIDKNLIIGDALVGGTVKILDNNLSI